MEPWRVCRQVVADSNHFVEEQDPDPDQSEKSDQSYADPQPWLKGQ
jgi:hypothetical protein